MRCCESVALDCGRFGLRPIHAQAFTGDSRTPLCKTDLTSMDGVRYLVNQPVEIRIFLAQPINFLDGMEHGGVMFAVEQAADLGQ